MASTSTNKQPLLIDRVFNNVVSTVGLFTGTASSIDIKGNNSSKLLIDCTTNDGGIVEDMFAISRGSTASVYFYLSSSIDYLRSDQAVFVGEISVTSTTQGAYANVVALPRVLAPVPQQQVAAAPAVDAATGILAGSPLRNQALYIPTGKALWVSIKGTAPINESDSTNTGSPIVGAQGGFY